MPPDRRSPRFRHPTRPRGSTCAGGDDEKCSPSALFIVCSSSNTDMRPSLLTAALFSFALLTATVRAQEAPSPGAPPPPSDAPSLPSSDVDAPTLKENVNLVNLYFSARDKDGFITNLAKRDCAITELG